MLKPTLKNTQHNIDELFDILKELSVKNQTLVEEEKELYKELFIEQILSVLNTTYDLLNHLDEKRILNGQLIKFENNINSVDQVISYYEQLLAKAKENEDDNLVWRHEFTINLYREFKKDSNEALQTLRMLIASNLMLEDEKFKNIHLSFLKDYYPSDYQRANRNYLNKELFIDLYGQLEGFKISHEQILKSAGLKIFNFFNAITKVQKKALADKIEHIFASLGENILIDIKRATNVRIIGKFKDTILLDYDGNKKNTLNDFGLYELIEDQVTQIIKSYKKSNNKEMIKQINKNKKTFEAIFLQQLFS